MDTIEGLIKIYNASATNLRKVAELAEAQDPESIVAKTSRAKAATYELVIDDLEDLLTGKEGD